MGSPLPAELDSLIDRGRHVLIYGEPGSGKTRLALHLASRAIAKGLQVMVLFSDAGTLPLISRLGLPLKYYPVYAIDDLARKVTRASLTGFFIVVDSLTSFYAEEGLGDSSILAYVSSILKESGGVSVAHSRKQGIEPPGFKFIEPYTDAVMEAIRADKGLFEVRARLAGTGESLKLRFRPKGWQVEWI